MGFPPKRPSMTPKNLGGCGWTFSFSPLAWSSCMSCASPTSRATSTKQGMEIDQGFLPMAVLKCWFPGPLWGPSFVVSSQWACMCDSHTFSPRNSCAHTSLRVACIDYSKTQAFLFLSHCTSVRWATAPALSAGRQSHDVAMPLCGHCLRGSQCPVVISGLVGQRFISESPWGPLIVPLSTEPKWITHWQMWNTHPH